MSKTPIILHACCATCAGYVIEHVSQAYKPILFFYNPNIHPQEEYEKRRDELIQYAQKMNLAFFEEGYQPQEWLELVRGLEDEPERGIRCNICFKQRLERTADFAKRQKVTQYTTTLTVSPHKKSSEIINLGNRIAKDNGLIFYSQDFKKQDGYKKTLAIAKKEGFYRQNYCGCIFSLRG